MLEFHIIYFNINFGIIFACKSVPKPKIYRKDSKWQIIAQIPQTQPQR